MIRALLPALLLVLPLPIAASPAAAQAPPSEGLDQPEVTVVLKGQRSAYRLAFPAFEQLGGVPAVVDTAAWELDRTLRADLEASGVFVLQGPKELAVLELTGVQERDFELYRSLQNELLLLTTIKAEGDRLVLEGRAYDLKGGAAVLGKRYRGAPSSARRIAHTFADELIETFSGRRGVSLTSIAFTSDRSGFKEVYLMDYDGADQRPITAHKSISMAPDWSPDGASLAYVSFVRRQPGLWLVDLATGRKSELVTDGTLNISPSFSPDGRKVAFARTVGDGNSEVFVVDRDGSNLKRLTHSSGIDTNPAWSPTGRKIAFTSSRAGSPQIFLMDAEGSDLRRLTFDGVYNDGAAWSPDGTRIVYASARQRGAFRVAVTDVVTLETRVLTSGAGSQETPSFSPDGRKIVYASDGGHTTGSGTQIFVIDADGGSPRQLTSSGNNSGPAWSGHPR